MKKALPVIAALAVLFAFTSSNNPKGLAQVQQIEGKYIFMFCEPVQAYTKIDSTSGPNNFSLLGGFGGLGGGPELEADFETLIERANKRVAKGKMKPYDALITKDPVNGAVFIKFNE